LNDDPLRELSEGALHLFADWPNRDIPAVTAGTYTIWEGADLLYVGMARRGMTAQPDPEEPHRAGFVTDSTATRRAGDPATSSASMSPIASSCRP
jgi:hypothetical protein